MTNKWSLQYVYLLKIDFLEPCGIGNMANYVAFN